MTTYTLSKAGADRTGVDAVVVGVLQKSSGPVLAPGAEAVAAAYGRKLAAMLASLSVTGKAGDTTLVPTAGTLKSPLLVLVGMGVDTDAEAVRRAAGAASRAVNNAASVALALPADDAGLVRAAVEGWALGSYRYDRYKSVVEDSAPADVVVLTELARKKEAQTALDEALVVSTARNLVRDWVNNPPGDFTPATFADAVVAANKGRKGARVTVKILDDAGLRDQGYGGVVGVGRGSDNPPRLVRLTYKPARAKVHLGLVGKGITYDSGGLSIKPAASMGTMKLDMAGAAAVVAATYTIAELGLPLQVTTLAPMAENMISGGATRPGDVLTMYGGKTVEVLNTDAEGRLILADALVTAVEAKPDLVVDVATLTGACMMALGDRITGLLGNHDGLRDRVRAASVRAGEAVWALPIPDEMAEKVKSNTKVADLAQHNVDRWGGALYAAAFLREFVGETPWAHLDMAGPAFNEKTAYGYTPQGGTGVMVATLVELARDLADQGFNP